MLTHPSLEASTNRDIRAWKKRTKNAGHSPEKRHARHDKRIGKRSTDLSQVVKVVLVVNPLVVGLQAIRLVGDVLHIQAEAVEELAFKKLPAEKCDECEISTASGREQRNEPAEAAQSRMKGNP